MANVAFLASDGILTGFKNSPTKLFREKMPWVGFSHKLAVLAWRSMQSHVQMPAYVHFNVGQQKITRANRFHVTHTTRIKQDIVFKGK